MPNLQVGQRVRFIGTLCGIHVGLNPGSTGEVVGYRGWQVVVDWDNNEEAGTESWCPQCLKPIDDPKKLTLDELATDIGWKLPAKEPA